MPAESLHPELREVVQLSRAQSDEARALVGELSPEAFRWKPEPKKWSPGEHLEHMVRSAEPYLELFDAAIAGARERGALSDGPYRHGRFGEWFIRHLEPPPKMRIPTLRRLEPSTGVDPVETPRRFEKVTAALVARARAARGVDLGRVRIRSPFVPVVSFTLGQAFRVVLAHNRRHLWLIRQVLTAPGCPRHD